MKKLALSLLINTVIAHSVIYAQSEKIQPDSTSDFTEEASTKEPKKSASLDAALKIATIGERAVSAQPLIKAAEQKLEENGIKEIIMFHNGKKIVRFEDSEDNIITSNEFNRQKSEQLSQKHNKSFKEASRYFNKKT